MRGRQVGSKNRPHVDVTCAQCKSISSVTYSRRAAKFCNQSCRIAFQASSRLGETEKREKQKQAAARWRKANPEIAKASFANYRSKNVAHCNQRTKIWREKNRDAYLAGKRRCRLERAFGISVEQYNEMLASQGGVCAICKNPETHQRAGVWNLSVDHCHETGRVRGLLCNNCNRGIGLLRDSAGLCRAAAEYLGQ